MKLLTDHEGKPSVTRLLFAVCVLGAVAMAVIWQWHTFSHPLSMDTDSTTSTLVLYLLLFGFGGKVSGAAVEKLLSK